MSEDKIYISSLKALRSFLKKDIKENTKNIEIDLYNFNEYKDQKYDIYSEDIKELLYNQEQINNNIIIKWSVFLEYNNDDVSITNLDIQWSLTLNINYIKNISLLLVKISHWLYLNWDSSNLNIDLQRININSRENMHIDIEWLKNISLYVLLAENLIINIEDTSIKWIDFESMNYNTNINLSNISFSNNLTFSIKDIEKLYIYNSIIDKDISIYHNYSNSIELDNVVNSSNIRLINYKL